MAKISDFLDSIEDLSEVNTPNAVSNDRLFYYGDKAWSAGVQASKFKHEAMLSSDDGVRTYGQTGYYGRIAVSGDGTTVVATTLTPYGNQLDTWKKISDTWVYVESITVPEIVSDEDREVLIRIGV